MQYFFGMSKPSANSGKTHAILTLIFGSRFILFWITRISISEISTERDNFRFFIFFFVHVNVPQRVEID